MKIVSTESEFFILNGNEHGCVLSKMTWTKDERTNTITHEQQQSNSDNKNNNNNVSGSECGKRDSLIRKGDIHESGDGTTKRGFEWLYVNMQHASFTIETHWLKS